MQNKIIRTGKSVTLNFKFEVLPSFYRVWISRTEMWSAGDMSWQTHGAVLPPCWAVPLKVYHPPYAWICFNSQAGPGLGALQMYVLGNSLGCCLWLWYLSWSRLFPYNSGSVLASCCYSEWLLSFAVPHPLPGDLARVTEASKTGSLLPLSQVEQRSPP